MKNTILALMVILTIMFFGCSSLPIKDTFHSDIPDFIYPSTNYENMIWFYLFGNALHKSARTISNGVYLYNVIITIYGDNGDIELFCHHSFDYGKNTDIQIYVSFDGGEYCLISAKSIDYNTIGISTPNTFIPIIRKSKKMNVLLKMFDHKTYCIEFDINGLSNSL
jgi:hypothetical protein